MRCECGSIWRLSPFASGGVTGMRIRGSSIAGRNQCKNYLLMLRQISNRCVVVSGIKYQEPNAFDG